MHRWKCKVAVGVRCDGCVNCACAHIQSQFFYFAQDFRSDMIILDLAKISKLNC